MCWFLNFVYLKTLISGGCEIRRWNRCEWMFILYGAIGDVGSGTQVLDRNLQCAISPCYDVCNFAAFSNFLLLSVRFVACMDSVVVCGICVRNSFSFISFFLVSWFCHSIELVVFDHDFIRYLAVGSVLLLKLWNSGEVLSFVDAVWIIFCQIVSKNFGEKRRKRKEKLDNWSA